eukprot:7866437-Pyramimonas_sp.AAC.2
MSSCMCKVPAQMWGLRETRPQACYWRNERVESAQKRATTYGCAAKQPQVRKSGKGCCRQCNIRWIYRSGWSHTY